MPTVDPKRLRNEPGLMVRLVTVGALGLASGLGALGMFALPRAAPAGASGTTPTLYVGDVDLDTVSSFAQPANGDESPISMLSSTPGPNYPSAEAFDGSHNLWVANGGNEQIFEYAVGQLGSTGSPVPDVTLSVPDLYSPSAMAFDGSGDLWVTAQGDKLFEFTASQLSSSGSPTPAVIISPAAIDNPGGLAFDGGGNLWMTNGGTTNTVIEFTASQLVHTGSPAPNITLTANAGSIDSPGHLAFDGSGNLWLANEGNSTVVQLGAGDITSSSSPSAAVVISANAGSLDAPVGLVFDGSGNLWVNNSDGSSLVEYLSSQLGSSGSLVPHVSLTPTVYGSPVDLAFDNSGNLWTPLAPFFGTSQVVELSAGQLGSSGNPAPPVVLSAANPAPINEPYALALDSAGDLWVANYDDGNLAMYTPSQLAAGGTPSPTLAIGGFFGPTGLAFDKAGDLWVADDDLGTLSELTPAQLATSGSPTPAVVLNTSSTVSGPEELAFDRAGDLWVTNSNNPHSSVAEFTPAQLAANGSPAPAVTIRDDGAGSVNSPSGLGFDSAGNLWVANCENSNLVQFTPAQQAAGGTPTPAVTVASDGSSAAELDCPWQLDFDAQGDLWVAQDDGQSVAGFTPAQLAASGSPAPTFGLAGASTGFSSPAGLAVGGPPAAPTGVTAALGGSTVSATWTAPVTVPWASDYVVTPIVNGTAQSPIDTGSAATAFSMPAVPGDSYAFSVQAANHYGPGPDSAVSNTVSSPPSPSQGYWEVASDGGLFSFGTAQFYGSMGGRPLNQPIVGMAPTPDEGGYWEVASDGGLFAFGDAPFFGSTGNITLNKPIVGMAATPDGQGYWEVASDGGIFAFGDAPFLGSTGNITLNKPIEGMAATPDGHGYWLVSSDGGLFSFGDANFFGSMGAKLLNKPIVGLVATPDGGGYFEVSSDGGLFTFGDAVFLGSMGGHFLNQPIVGMAGTPDGKGYWEVSSDGGLFSFGDAVFLGSMGGRPLNKPIVGVG